MADKFNAKAQGFMAETNACEFLEKAGLNLLDKNYSCHCGEIDLIMKDKDSVVFVEVRQRFHTEFGSAVESVNLQKQRKLIKSALLYLQKKRWLNTVNCRFDVIGIDANNKIEWIKNAITVDY